MTDCQKTFFCLPQGQEHYPTPGVYSNATPVVHDFWLTILQAFPRPLCWYSEVRSFDYASVAWSGDQIRALASNFKIAAKELQDASNDRDASEVIVHRDW